MLVLHLYLSNVGGADLDCIVELVLAFLNTVSFEMCPQYVLHLYLSNVGGAEHIRDPYCAAHLIDQKMPGNGQRSHLFHSKLELQSCVQL